MKTKSKLLNALISDKRINNGEDKKIQIIVTYYERCNEYLTTATLYIFGEYKGIKYNYFQEDVFSDKIAMETRYDCINDIFLRIFPEDYNKDFKDSCTNSYHVSLNKIDVFANFLETLTTATLIPYSEF